MYKNQTKLSGMGKQWKGGSESERGEWRDGDGGREREAEGRREREGDRKKEIDMHT